MDPIVKAVVDRIAKRNLAQLEDLAGRADVPYPTVLKVARGYVQNPLARTILKLEAALNRERSRKRRRA